MDLSRLEKLINLTASENDYEALSALRQAQKLVNGDFWKVLTNLPKGRSIGTETGRIKALEIELNATRRHLKSVQQELAETKERFKQKPVVTNGNFDLKKYLDRPGYYEVFYELTLEEYVRALRIIPSSHCEHWQSVATLKSRFESALGLNPASTSLKRFSQLFSKFLDLPSVKGGRKKEAMGFIVTVEKKDYSVPHDAPL